MVAAALPCLTMNRYCTFFNKRIITSGVMERKNNTWIIHKFRMMRPGFRLFLKNSVWKPEIQNTLLNKGKEEFWPNS
jgi:hypothetical protein